MQTRQLGNTDLKLTTVGLGTWAMGGPWQFGWGPQDDDEAIAAIIKGLELGINWIDTAPAYGLGHSEELVRQALEQTNAKKSLAQMLKFGINEKVFPEVIKLHKMELASPHVHDAWTHTLQVANYCQQLMTLSHKQPKIDGLHPRIVQVINILKNHKKSIFDYMKDPLNMHRSMYSLLIFACIYHDVGKGAVTAVIKDGRKSFPRHAKIGSGLIRQRAKAMGFSNNEIEFLSKIVKYHMKPSQIEFIDDQKKNIHIHRFFKKTGSAGILVGFIHLADVLATYEETLTEDRWNRAISSVNNIFDAYFNHSDTIINPPILINGNDILEEFDLHPGKKIGDLLDKIAEAQVIGAVNTKEEAIEYLGKIIRTEKQFQGNL